MAFFYAHCLPELSNKAQISLLKGWEDANPNDTWSGRLTKGWFKSSAAVDRTLWSAFRHLSKKSRASLERELGIGGLSPFPILNIAAICDIKELLISEKTVSS